MRLTEVSAVSAAEAKAQRIKATISIISCSHATESNCGFLKSLPLSVLVRVATRFPATPAPYIGPLTPFCHPQPWSFPGVEACAGYAPEHLQPQLQEGHHGAPQNLL